MSAHDAVVIGAGQAGLAVSRALTARGIEHEVLEREHVGSAWTHLWDAFRLNTPAWSVQLPGLSFDAPDPDGFPSADDLIGHLRRYAEDAPVREGIDVATATPIDDGFVIGTNDGEVRTRALVVCTGAYQEAYRPARAADIPGSVAVLNTREYRNADALPDGRILIVGSGQSGCQIAEDLLDAGREVVVSCGRAPWAPRRIGDHDLVWWNIETGFLDTRTEDLPSPAARFAATVTASGVDGGHDLHVRTLRRKGATLVGRFLGVDGTSVRFAPDLAETVAWGDARYDDLRRDVQRLCAERSIPAPELPDPDAFDDDAPGSIPVAGLGAVVFASGFRPEYGFIRARDVVDAMGFPNQHDGVSDAVAGLFFCGVHFLRRRRSSLLFGVGDDAAVVADGVASYLGATRDVPR
ncbi:MAG TPA: NAD(P)/FAD-dependent oxidoreductase [Actinomycetota bacterium]|nr:NAD(P)/FAD-dependent oxidoreductase [Actinomycetota bacterium]